ncbi:hypothetical protein L3Q82_022290 [Scortum barcoo]|uniref:Uncharacterized protein n=1 Tax=Scortum barcoo TaxID=214431 RepID=A0ACB8X439_9TELE|nr:hypothetical protein L3Q82_022290 [Scortum barcoo]
MTNHPAHCNGMQSLRKEHLYKVLVIGDLGVGKTSIIRRYVHQTYSTNYRATIGVDFALKVLNWDSETVRLQLWDIAGGTAKKSGTFRKHDTSVLPLLEAMGAFIVFDVTRRTQPSRPSELTNNGIKMDQFCKDHGFVGWFETSAKDNLNIAEAANFLVKHIMATENDILKSVVPDTISPQLDSNRQMSCSGCFK